MAKVKVKICGITNWTDARRAAEAGADFLGFNFYRKSPRYVAPGRARKIVRRLPKRVAAVGVFVNEREETILQIARRVGLKYLQLHGEEAAESVSRLARFFPVIKAARVGNGFRPAQLAKFRRVRAVLLDGFKPGLHGGTGKAFNWKIARAMSSDRRIFLAGGLAPENIVEAIRVARPYAVDICSGVESRPGKKDPAKVDALMRAVQSAQRGVR
ncbi:MAG TPA: phosphoribosylanthranilate isomerase [Candidatus Limnocylindrales bacterium]|nr:phosphoribosylanthranilate isomerase [Candidatus Limnocylindrales bacterium]